MTLRPVPAGTGLPRRALLLGPILVLPTGCASIPADVDGSLERITSGTLRVGLSVNPPWTEVDPSGEPNGSEVDLVDGFARHVEASVDFEVHGESRLVELMDLGELDLLIGGLTEDSPWIDTMALTRPYANVPAPDGGIQKMVIGVRAGENALLVALERYLAERAGEIPGAEG